MKLIINASAIYKGGAEQVAVSFINECLNFPENSYYVFLRENISSQLNSSDFGDNFRFYSLSERPGSGWKNYRKAVNLFDDLEKKIRPDCAISTGGHGYWKPEVPLVSGFNIPHYIYPESPYMKRLSVKQKMYWKIKKSIDGYFYSRADALLVQTEDVNRRLKKWIGDANVYTVSNTVHACFYENEHFPDKLPAREDHEIRLLTLSSYYPHKNLEIIESVIPELLKRDIRHVRFVLTLPQDVFEKKFSDAFRTYIYNVGPVPIRECPSLYRECDAMFLPTLLECFSASYAEAMVMDKPILTSDLGFAHTVCGDAAIYFDPLDGVDIAQKIIQLDTDRDLVKQLIQRGRGKLSQLGTARSRAERFLSICREVSDDRK